MRFYEFRIKCVQSNMIRKIWFYIRSSFFVYVDEVLHKFHFWFLFQLFGADLSFVAQRAFSSLFCRPLNLTFVGRRNQKSWWEQRACCRFVSSGLQTGDFNRQRPGRWRNLFLPFSSKLLRRVQMVPFVS